MEWFKKHTDTVMVLSAILGAVLWMNTRFNELDKDIIVIKTVLIMKNIMPCELASNKDLLIKSTITPESELKPLK
jgi:hypothetical protein